MKCLGIVAVLAVLAGCADNQERLPPNDLVGCAGYEEPGPFAAGVTTLLLENGDPLEIWYPAPKEAADGVERDTYDMREWLPPDAAAKIPDEESPLFEMNAYRDLPVHGGGEFPVVLFSHGMGGYRMQSSFLMSHLATWGFIVAAPEHPERGLAILVADGAPSGDNGPAAVREALVIVERQNSRDGSRFQDRVDTSRVAITGHSAGGAAVIDVAADPGIDAWMTFASGGFGTSGGPEIPSFMMAGTADEIAVVDQIEGAYDRQTAQKRYLAIAGMGHLGFTDICAIGRDRGGVLQIAIDHGVEVPDILLMLGNDGCEEGDLRAEDGWPVVNHFATAELKYALRVNSTDAGLDDEVTGCFGDLVANYLHD